MLRAAVTILHAEIRSGEQLLIDIKIAFILSAVTEVVSSSQNPPDLRSEPERVRKNLEDDIAVRRAIARTPQAGET